MEQKTSCLLSIAGFDPSAGAGILADIKTFEAHKVYGLGVVSAITFQNDVECKDVLWMEEKCILEQIEVLKKRFDFPIVKIGIMKDWTILTSICTNLLKDNADLKIILDPIIRASTGFKFQDKVDKNTLISILKNCFLITPNIEEAIFLTGIESPQDAAIELSEYCNVLLKGGHSIEEEGVDYLFFENKIQKILPQEIGIYPKHGSGCVVSSAIAANLFLGKDLPTSCINGKKYIEQFLNSNFTLLGQHHV